MTEQVLRPNTKLLKYVVNITEITVVILSALLTYTSTTGWPQK